MTERLRETPSPGPARIPRDRVLVALAGSAVAVFATSTLSWARTALDLGAFGFDYLAYDAAARRLLVGAPLYDTHFQSTGAFGLYYYPPPFVLAILPLTLLDAQVATWLWAFLSWVAVVGGIALMPVPARVRWSVLLLAGLSFPVAKALVLGQVGALLLLCFAASWRWLTRDMVVGAFAAAGTLIKLQPIVVLVWAALVRRFRILIVGVAGIVSASAFVTLISGLGSWGDWLALLLRVGDPVSQVENVNLGALAYRAGLGHEAAVVVHWVHAGFAALVWLFLSLRRAPVVGFMATVVVSQLVSPILWDHYAMVLLVPVAWLMGRGIWWAAAVPLLSPSFLGPTVPPFVYLAGYWATLAMLSLRRFRYS